MSRTRNWRGWLLLLSAIIIACDRVTKHWVSQHVAIGDVIVVIPRVFGISHVQNPGAAFSMFTNTADPTRVRWMLTSFSIVAAVVVFVILMKIGRRLSLSAIALALVLGGAIGNAWDRVAYGTVVDFLEVHIIHYHYPDFNVADSAIVVGAILLVLDALRPRKAAAPASHPDSQPGPDTAHE